MVERSRFRACLLGGAVGDALGSAVEYYSLSEIIRRYGPSGIQEYGKVYGREGAVTDDTQMTLFTAEGLIRGLMQERNLGEANYARVVANAYQRWLLTQGESNDCVADPLVSEPGWLYGVSELHARRSPGQTCIDALRGTQELGQIASNYRHGCGAVARVAPVGLFAESLEESFALGCEIASLTHGHPRAGLCAGAFAVIIFSLKEGESVVAAVDTALRCLAQHEGHEPITTVLQQALRLARSESDSDVAVAQLGAGWIAEEALAIATYCALTASSFSDGIIVAVNHDGDSDTTGAMAGSLLGASTGEASIPDIWLENLELRRVISDVADDLYDCRRWSVGQGAADRKTDEMLWTRYPGY